MAERSGLGFYGKHGIILSREFGSYIVLGEIITDLEIEPQGSIGDSCGSCRLCIERCPTGASVTPYILARERCFQYLTNWSGFLPESYRKLWGKRLYGCTTCQEVCPRNKKVHPKERIPVYGRAGPSFPLIPLLKMTEVEYRKRFKQNQMGAKWIKFDAIRRNAIVALGNIGDPGSLDILVEHLFDREPMIRGHAAWAVGQLGDRRGKRSLEKALTSEQDELVKREISQALDGLGH
ncbi:MAG: HEAT repeat domain-containing protein, partial [candidate division WOR-3 bacterium]